VNAVSIRLHDLIVIFLVGSKANDVHSQPNQLSGLCVGPNQIVHTTIPNPIDHITIILLNGHHYLCYAYVEYDQSHISDGANAHAN
jgi:hypothetical protein